MRRGTDVVLRLPNGEPLHVYTARPRASGPGVVVLHAWWGLVADFMDVCDRLAEEGFIAAAPDLLAGRTAATRAEAEGLVKQRPAATAVPAVAAAVRWLQAQPELEPGRVALVGFSMGGAVALRAAAGGIGEAVVTFYGTTAPDQVEGLNVPVLGHFAEADDYERADAVAGLSERLQRQGAPATFITYPGTRHWFFEHTRAEYDPQAADRAWRSTLGFLREHLGARSTERGVATSHDKVSLERGSSPIYKAADPCRYPG